MSKGTLVVDLFVEDKGHEDLLRPLVERIAAEEGRSIVLKVRSARGGHPRVIKELKLYQEGVEKGIGGLTIPDLLVIAIDTNCKGYVEATKEIKNELGSDFDSRAILACPDPHVELWYMADPDSFHDIVGVTPVVGPNKCESGHYKKILASAVTSGGHPATLGGIEFARDLANGMDLFKAGKVDNSLKHFITDLKSAMRQAP